MAFTPVIDTLLGVTLNDVTGISPVDQEDENITHLVDAGTMSNSNMTASARKMPEPPTYILVTVTIFFAAIFIVGLLGNALVTVVVWKNHSMRSYTNCLLVNLSIADALVIAICMPSAFIDLFAKETWLMGGVMCKLITLIENMVALGSVFTIVAISSERYLAICHPLRVKVVCTFNRMLRILVMIWLLAISICLPFLWITIYKDSTLKDGTPVKVCRNYIRLPWQRGYILCLTGVFFVIPCLVLIVLYSVIARKLAAPQQSGSNPGSVNMICSSDGSRSAKSIEDRLLRSNVKGKRQSVMMIVVVVALFFVCILPIEVVRLWFVYPTKQLGFEEYLNIVYFARVMFYLNSAINPVCYNLLSTKFRRAFWRLFRPHQNMYSTGTVSSSSYYRPYWRSSRRTTRTDSLYSTRSNSGFSNLGRSQSGRQNGTTKSPRVILAHSYSVPCDSDCDRYAGDRRPSRDGYVDLNVINNKSPHKD